MTGKDKGTAIQEFMSERPFRGRMPAFLGDDLTDEYGFAMINRLGGYSIKVGIGPTAARWRLRDVTEVRGWLKRGRPAPRPTR
jgi:trehalose 6-phosphate phosphatase